MSGIYKNLGAAAAVALSDKYSEPDIQSGNDVTNEDITFSVVTKGAGEGILTKKMDLVDGGIVKDSSKCTLDLGHIKTFVITIEKFANGLRGLKTNQALVHGIAQFDESIICSRRKLDSVKADNPGSNVITRTKDYLSYPDGAGLMMFDHDKPRNNAVALHDKAIETLSPAKLIAVIGQILPEINASAWVSTPSTSSCIYSSNGTELRGEGDGFHLYLFPKNAQDIERFMDVLGKRSILAGYGRIEFSKNGSMLIRTIIDLSVGSPERLDFVAGAVCMSGLEQRLPKPYLHEGRMLDTQRLPDLTTKEQLKYDKILRKLKNKAAPEQKKIQGLYVDEKVKELTTSGMDTEVAKTIVAARLSNVLDDEVELYLESGKNITVGELLNDGSKYDEVSLADPLEPEYGGWSRNKAKFFWNDGAPRIHSFAHGSVNYTFSRYDSKIVVEDVYIEPILEPINPNVFAKHVADSIKSLNPDFHCEGVMSEVFVQSGNIYNHCIDLNRKGKTVHLVNPAATGSGKTVSMEEYATRIGNLGFSCLLVVSEIDTAIDTAKRINDKTASDVAGTYYSISQEHPKCNLRFDVEDLPQVAIITHAMFIARSDSGKQIDSLRKFKGKQRDLVVVDERIDLVKRISFGTEEVPDVVAVLNRDGGLTAITNSLKLFVEYIASFGADGNHKSIGSFKDVCVCLTSKLNELLNELRNGKYDLSQKMKGRRNPYDERASVMDLIERISYVLSDSFNQVREGRNIVCYRVECLADKFGSTVILDATSTINPEYDIRSLNDKNIWQIAKIPSRNYSSVNLNLCSNSRAKQSKTSLYNKPKKDKNLNYFIDSYLGVIDSILKNGDRLLVATYKVLVPYFNDRSSYGDQVKFVHWGSSDTRGSNKFKDFNKAMVIGLFRRPKHYYLQTLSAIGPIDTYVPMNGSMVADANYLKNRLIVDDMIQFFNRVRCRTAIDAYGNCLPVELYCFTGGNEKLMELIKSSCGSEMPNIQFRDWEPKDIKKITTRETANEKRAVSFVDYLCGKIGFEQEVYLKDLLNVFNLSSAIGTRVVNSEFFEGLLEDAGIVFIPSRGGHKNPATFVLPKSKP